METGFCNHKATQSRRQCDLSVFRSFPVGGAYTEYVVIAAFRWSETRSAAGKLYVPLNDWSPSPFVRSVDDEQAAGDLSLARSK